MEVVNYCIFRWKITGTEQTAQTDLCLCHSSAFLALSVRCGSNFDLWKVQKCKMNRMNNDTHINRE